MLQSYYNITIIFRKIILPIIIVYVLILPVISIFFPIKKLYSNYDFKINDIILLWTSSIVTILLVVNLFFKNVWGRARPGEILQLGGKENFSPWYQISDSCSTNCSFVSGDAAVGFFIIVFYLITKKEFYLDIFQSLKF